MQKAETLHATSLVMFNLSTNGIVAVKYQNKYHTSSIRLQSWDYRWHGAYFITICTKNKVCSLGDIVNGKMQLSGVGVLADVFLHEIKKHTKNIDLNAFVVMPNHVHAILTINQQIVETLHATSLRQPNKHLSAISPKAHSISTIVRSYKSAVTKHAHRLGYDFAWQARFHDHIIRTEESFNKISEYVDNNPHNWEKDKFYPEQIV